MVTITTIFSELNATIASANVDIYFVLNSIAAMIVIFDIEMIMLFFVEDVVSLARKLVKYWKAKRTVSNKKTITV